MFVDIVLRL